MDVEGKIVAHGVTGTVVRVVNRKENKGWGWIAPDDGSRDIFVYQDDVDVERGFSSPGFSNYHWANICVGDQVRFDIVVGKKVPHKAVNVRYMFFKSNIGLDLSKIPPML